MAEMSARALARYQSMAAAARRQRRLEHWLPWIVIGGMFALWEIIVVAFGIAEFILPGERAAFKVGLYYFAILGGIWLGSFVATLLLPFLPYRHAKSLALQMTTMDGYSRSFAEFDADDWRLLRLEAVLAVAWWSACIWLFGWNWQLLLVLYACYAFSYSSLQWVYHMRTPLDRVEGAYDLRLPAPVRWLFLNFNYNLSHHRHPRAPWRQTCAADNRCPANGSAAACPCHRFAPCRTCRGAGIRR